MPLSSVSVRNLTRNPLPRLPFEKIKNAILGKDYDLSVVCVGNTLSQKLNRERRGKNKPTNILSFALDANTGEIFLNLGLCKKECASFERNYTNFLQFLFIHGLLHLAGHEHGSTMEHIEGQYREKFGV